MCKPPGVRALAPLRSRSRESGPRQSRGTGGQRMGLGGTRERRRAQRDGEKMGGSSSDTLRPRVEEFLGVTRAKARLQQGGSPAL